MKTMEGESSSAALKSSRTSFGPSPKYFWMSSEPTTLRKVALVLLATAFASSVFPVPGSPYRMTPYSKATQDTLSFSSHTASAQEVLHASPAPQTKNCKSASTKIVKVSLVRRVTFLLDPNNCT